MSGYSLEVKFVFVGGNARKRITSLPVVGRKTF